jgi:predicted short-subunit dehydrogenase-like oxidoreductase (DUF2520 family)
VFFIRCKLLVKVKRLISVLCHLCIEGADQDIAKQLKELAHSISNNVYDIDSQQRKILHLAAVFACNFPNYLYNIAQQILAQHDLNFDLDSPVDIRDCRESAKQFTRERTNRPGCA